MNNTKFHKQGCKYDEYYTTYEEVEWIFNNLTIPVKDKIVYCFCDNDNSAWVRYMKVHEQQLEYKELIYTSDDYNTHLDLFDKADIYITNPPFSKMFYEIIPILNDHPEKDYFLFGSIGNITGYRDLLGDRSYIYRRKQFEFITSHINDKTGTNKTYVQLTCYITSIKQESLNKKINKKEYKDRIYWKSKIDDKCGLMCDRLNLIPDDYDGYILAPSTVLLDPVIREYDIIQLKHNFYRSTDDKPRYIRTLIKKKNILNNVKCYT